VKLIIPISFNEIERILFPRVRRGGSACPPIPPWLAQLSCHSPYYKYKKKKKKKEEKLHELFKPKLNNKSNTPSDTKLTKE